MPLFSSSHDLRKVAPPPKWFWGEAKGRVRHIEVATDGLYAVYVLEEEPSWIEIRMRYGDREWAHKVWAPWRYYLVRVRYDTRVEGGNMGFMFFALDRLKDIDDQRLVYCAFPNVFPAGGVCLGFTTNIFDRSPVRSAWNAVRKLYSIPGNQWWTDSIPSSIKCGHIANPTEHANHYLISGNDITCRWSSLYPDEVMKLPWETVSSSIRSFLDAGKWEYQRGSTYTDRDVDSILAKLEKQRIS